MFPLTPELVAFLLSPRAADALDELAGADLDDTLTVVTRLRRIFESAEAAALYDQAVLRRRAAKSGKFPEADRLWFVDEALEQATSRAVASYRAHWLVDRGARVVADLGCGIGADTIAMAQSGLRVLAVELDPIRARLCAANVAALGLANHVDVVCADWTQLPGEALAAVDAAFADPARRVGRSKADSRRTFSLHDMVPSLSEIERLRDRVPDLLVKVSPGVDLDEVPASATVTFVAEGIRLKEAMLAFGGLRSEHRRRAVLLPGSHELVPDGARDRFRVPDVRRPQGVLYEPNPAVLRAGLVRDLGRRLGAGQIDPEIAYLTADHYTETPFARAWHVLRHGPFNLKALNRWLREAGAGTVTLKKRGSPIDVDAFRRRLKTVRDGDEVTVFLTMCEGEAWMVLCGHPIRSTEATG